MSWVWVRWFLAFVPGALLAGCSLFPGIHYDAALPGQQSGFSSISYASSGTPESAGQDGYVVTPITPEFLRTQAAPPGSVANDNPELSREIASYSYLVQPHDALSIVIWGDPAQTAAFKPQGSAANGVAGVPIGFKVDSDGTLYFPYVGSIDAAGKTTEQIRAQITNLMGRFINNPQITVDVTGFNSQKFELAGAVVKPGLYPITDMPLVVSQAIAAAGGVVSQTPAIIANTTTVTRSLGDLSRVLYIHDQMVTVLNLRALYREGNRSQDRLVHPGDIIQVPDNSFEQIHVIGEVKAPGDYPLNDGRLHLSEVLGNAGGLDLTTANPARIFVFRGAYQKPQVFWLDARSPDALLLANEFELQPQDVVYVAAAGLVDLNRAITLILPTVQTIYETKVLIHP